MSSFAERVKLLLQKRLDTTKWPIGDSGQGPGGIRYLTDGQGNAIAIITTSVNPNDAEPIGPGSAESAAEVDPIHVLRDLQVPHTFTKKTSSKEIILGATIETATNTRATFHDQRGNADYSVPTGKELLIYKEYSHATLVTAGWDISFGDDGVAEGTAAPTNEVFISGSISGTGLSLMHLQTVDLPQEDSIPWIIPAGKFPCLVSNSTSQSIGVVLLGVEYDA